MKKKRELIKNISFGSLHGVAIHQEMVVRYLKKHGSDQSDHEWARAYEEAQIVLESLNRMTKDHPNYRKLN